jgi:predicted nucleic acid-binding protein
VEIAIDSSVLVGLLVTNDIWYARATELWTAIERDGHTGVVFDCVVAETVSVAVRRLREKGYVTDIPAFLSRLSTEIPREVLTWILPDVPRLYPQVLELIESSSGELNFNDGLIALCCRERGILAIASFDSDFDLFPWFRRVSIPSDISSIR